MPVHNSEIATMFDHVADLLDIQQANPFRIRAYRNAAATIRDQGRNIADMLEEGEDLSELPGIGVDLAGKISEIVKTGHLGLLDEIAKDIPDTLVEITAIPGIGPKRARALHEALDIGSLDDLEAAAEAGKIAGISGFGPKTQQKIRDELKKGDLAEHRVRLAMAEDFAIPLLAYIKDTPGVQTAEIAGSYRRRKETVGDLDILAAAQDGKGVIDRFVVYDEVETIVSQGETRSTVKLRSGLQVDLRVVPKVSFGAALHYFTGSKAHNIACRRRAQDRGLKLNEYGVFDGKTRICGATEQEVYDAIGLPPIPPVLRENRGEIEAAEKGALPELITLADIRGDLHCHTTASDGRNSIREMAEAAIARGYEYLAISDHSKSQTQAGGLDEAALAKHLDEIDRVRDDLGGIHILKASEVDILKDGSLDYDDDVLDKLDLVIAAVHANFDLDEDKQTERIIRAMDNRHVNIIAHPTGRLIGERRPYALNMKRLMKAAADRGCFLEINAEPLRLDLNDINCRMAKDAGVMVSIGTDAHSTGGLDHMRFGLDQARRGWLGPDNVVNTRNWSALSKLLRR
ncbi:DNA polymerase/3'-5' exonuclease PolX [Pseudogemmobacter sp. W21_MBD1_M6]|uniref:DNA polymerase/3'-5' exonuclease PolX n=1 Tax=Pseudogemmobacter sp. W21_MBD1_M6 TaxID=3240271 RepID=UPI003F97390D